MAELMGMDVEAGRVKAQQLNDVAERELTELYRVMTNLVTGFRWEGPDSGTFRNNWNSQIKRLFDGLKEVCQQQATELKKHVGQQEAASGASAASGARAASGI